MGDSGARILVIEDDASVSLMIGKILSRAGHQVTLAATGAEGMKKIASSPFDLVVIDKNLSDGDGIRLLRSMRSSHPQVQAIVITAYPSAGTRVAAEGLGALAYLTKPFDGGELVTLCAGAIGAPVVSRRPTQQRVLVVEDDDSVARLSKHVLTRDGFAVELARSMGAAVALLEKQHFDLVLVDRMLPGADGLEVVKLARMKLPNVAVIMMTAGEVPSKEILAQMDGFIPKPFTNLRVLVEEIRKALETRPPPQGDA